MKKRLSKEEHEMRRQCKAFQRNKVPQDVFININKGRSYKKNTSQPFTQSQDSSNLEQSEGRSSRNAGEPINQEKSKDEFTIASLFETLDKIENDNVGRGFATADEQSIPKFREWDESSMKILMQAILSGEDREISDEDKKKLMGMFPVAIAQKRIEIYKLPIEFTDDAWLLFALSGDRAGVWIMNLGWIMFKAAQHHVKKITAKFLGETVFPDGYLSEAYFSYLWNSFKIKNMSSRSSQSLHPDNSLDYPEAWQSAINLINK